MLHRALTMAAFTLLIAVQTPWGRVWATTIVAGDSQYQTTSGSVGVFVLSDFFGTGSDPFSGFVDLVGLPLDPQPAAAGGPIFNPTNPVGGLILHQNLSNALPVDTVIRRLDPLDLLGPGSSGTVPIEIVALSLVSVAPITVTYGGSPSELWNVNVGLSPGSPASGLMTLTLTTTNPDGGTFTSQINIRPRLTFTRIQTPMTRLYDDFDVYGFVGTFSVPEQPAGIPEPASSSLVVLGGALVFVYRRTVNRPPR